MMLSLQSAQRSKRQELAKKEYENPPTTETASNSSTNTKLRRKRGVSLSKEHCIQFDRIYQQKDLLNPPNLQIKSDQKSQFSYGSRNQSNSRNKITLQSVKSEKRLGLGVVKNENTTSRINIGGHEKSRLRKEQQGESMHQMVYGNVERKKQRGRGVGQAPQYGIVRRT